MIFKRSTKICTWLLDFIDSSRYSSKRAGRTAQSVRIEGRSKDYAFEIYQDEIESKLGKLEYYFDYEALGRDLVLGGDVYEYERGYKKYIITS